MTLLQVVPELIVKIFLQLDSVFGKLLPLLKGRDMNSLQIQEHFKTLQHIYCFEPNASGTTRTLLELDQDDVGKQDGDSG